MRGSFRLGNGVKSPGRQTCIPRPSNIFFSAWLMISETSCVIETHLQPITDQRGKDHSPRGQ